MENPKRILVSLSEYHRQHLERLATKYDCSMSEVLRIGLVKLANEEQP